MNTILNTISRVQISSNHRHLLVWNVSWSSKNINMSHYLCVKKIRPRQHRNISYFKASKRKSIMIYIFIRAACSGQEVGFTFFFYFSLIFLSNFGKRSISSNKWCQVQRRKHMAHGTFCLPTSVLKFQYISKCNWVNLDPSWNPNF